MADFRGTLLQLGNDAFFEIIRNYLGPIKTPFNKHDLIDRLVAFLRKDDIQERIASLIDEPDAEILTTIWILDEPTHEDLFAFLQDSYSFLDLHRHLLNLEDRLLIYRDGDLVRLNPELLPRLQSGILHPARLFHGKMTIAGDLPDSRHWLDDALLVSFYSLLLEKPALYKSDGELRKRAADTLRQRMPAVMEPLSSSGQPRRLRVDGLVEGLLGLGLAVEEGSHLRPIAHAWNRWARLTPLARLAEVVGAAATEHSGERTDTVLVARALLIDTPSGLATSEFGFIRLGAAATGVPADSVAKCVSSLEQFGLLVRSGETLRLWRPVDEAVTTGDSGPVRIVIAANFELTLPAEAGFADGLFVSEVCELIRHDRYPRFELTKDRVAAAMRAGIAGSHISERLSLLCGGTIPQNVSISIRSWEEEYQSMRLHRGVVLQVSEPRRHAVNHSPAVWELIVDELSPGIYLVDEADVKALQDALREAGGEMVPELPPADPVGYVPWQEAGPPAQTGGRIARVNGLVEQAAAEEPDPLEADSSITALLENALSAQSLPADQAEELSQRIKRKLIVAELQLKSGALKPEKTEAKGLDYTGKVRIIEQSLQLDEYLEVIERTSDGDPLRHLVEPVLLRKDGTSLYLDASELPDRTPVSFSVSKLGLVRRLRAALFKRQPGD
jgi:hypothetical protein